MRPCGGGLGATHSLNLGSRLFSEPISAVVLARSLARLNEPGVDVIGCFFTHLGSKAE